MSFKLNYMFVFSLQWHFVLLFLYHSPGARDRDVFQNGSANGTSGFLTASTSSTDGTVDKPQNGLLMEEEEAHLYMQVGSCIVFIHTALFYNGFKLFIKKCNSNTWLFWNPQKRGIFFQAIHRYFVHCNTMGCFGDRIYDIRRCYMNRR